MAWKFIDLPVNTWSTAPTKTGGRFIDKQWLTLAQKLWAWGVWVVQGISDVWQNTVGQPIGRLAQKIGKSLEGTKVQSWIQALAKKLVWVKAVQDYQTSEAEKRKFSDYNVSKWNIITDTNILTPEQQQSGRASGGREVGKLIWTTALTTPIGWIVWAWGKAIGMAWSTLGRIGIWALQWAAQTQVANIWSEWELATAWETLLGAWIGGWINALWEAGTAVKKWLYNKAFSQTKKSISEKWYELSWKKPGTLVLDQKLSPSVKKGMTQIQDKLQNTRTKVEETADKAGNISWIGIRGWLKKDMWEQLWFDKLPQNAKSTKELVKKVSNIVDDYIPTWKLTGKEMIQQIKNLNKTLPDKLLWMGIGDPTSAKWFTQALEKWMKKVLDTKAEQWGAGANVITELYRDYGKQKTVQAILKDENLRKTLWRQIVGSSVWAWIGGIAWYEDIKQWDLIGGGLKIVWWALAGNVATRLATNPTVLMKLGNVASKWLADASNIKKTIWSYLSSKLKK